MNLNGMDLCLYLVVIAVLCAPLATSYEYYGTSIDMDKEMNAELYCDSLGIRTSSVMNDDGTYLNPYELPNVYFRCLKGMMSILTTADEILLIDKIVRKIGKVSAQKLDSTIVNVKNIKEYLNKWSKKEQDGMIQNNSTRNLTLMAVVLKDWPKDLISKVNTGLPDFGRNLEAAAQYADSVWWKEILSYIWFPDNFFQNFLTIEKLVKQRRYQTTLTNFVHYGRRIQCSGEVLLEILDFDIRRETQILKDSFNHLYFTLCISKKPINYIREILQDKIYKDLNVGAIILLIQNSDELKNKIKQLNLNLDPESGWDTKTALYHMAQCLKVENCDQAVARAIPSAQKINLNPTIFNDWLNCNVMDLRYERTVALDFIAALNAANIQFVIHSEKDAEDIHSFMTMLFILDRTEKEKTKQEGATLSQGLIGFLDKALTADKDKEKWSMSQIIDFLEKSTLNHVDVPDYPLMLEITNQSSPEKILMIQNMFSNLNVWKIGDKTIWTFLKERNIKLDLYDFVIALNKEDVSSSAAITNFFTNEKLVDCTADTVLSVAYYSKMLGYTLTSIQYKQLFNEVCVGYWRKVNQLKNVIVKATTEKLEYDKLYYRLLQENGKVTNANSVNSQVKYGRVKKFQNTVKMSLGPDLLAEKNSQQTQTSKYTIPCHRN